MEKLLTISDVAEITGLSTSTLYKLTSRNAIPHIKLLRRVLFETTTISDWVSAHAISEIKIEEVKDDSI